MFDQMQKLGDSTVQLGPFNNRVYLMKLAETDSSTIIGELERLCAENNFSKVFAKVPIRFRSLFEKAGYIEEAQIPGFYNRTEDAIFLGRFLSDERATESHPDTVREVLDVAKAKADAGIPHPPQDGTTFAETGPSDVEEMSEVYRQVFATYPFPIHEPAYLRETMQSHVRYFCARRNGRIIALSSAEMDASSSTAEMTDFATLPEARGQSLAVHLLQLMEKEILINHIKTAFTIARAMSAGMNVTFSRAGYLYTGTLTNNTNISGQIESMNVWYKPLEK